MIRVALIEDEKVVLQGMKMVLGREPDIELVGFAEDGMEGLELIRREIPDLVLTDIRMPELSGLEMIEHAQKEFSDMVFVIFSGFNEFQYAQKAIGMGVLDYLKKPVTISDLRRVLDRAKGMIEYKRNYHSMKERIQQTNRSIVEQALYKLMNQPTDMEEENMDMLLREAPVILSSTEIAVLRVGKLRKSGVTSDEYRRVIHRFTFSMLGDHVFEVYSLAIEDDILFVYFNQECEFFDFYGNIDNEKRLLEKEGFIFYAGLSNIYTEPGYLKRAFSESKDALSYAESVYAEGIIQISEVENQRSGSQDLTDSELQLHPVQIVKKYIDTHYPESITLEILAEQVRMNPAYLSVIFKKETGIAYSSYLTEVRIRHAKEMLELGEKAKEVCNKVGYFDYRYFNKQFKKVTGMTPDTYRRSKLYRSDE